MIPRIANSLPHGNFELVLGIAVFLLGLWSFLKRESAHSVVIHSASGETKSSFSKAKAEIQKIVDALNQAIVIRG
jgi:hypothetical protein